MNYNNKKFKALSNSDNGEVSDDVIFHYQQEGNVIWCDYAGGNISKGNLLGTVQENGELHFSYHQINTAQELRTGRCTSTPKILANGKIRLHEIWQWTSGDNSQGTSILEEI